MKTIVPDMRGVIARRILVNFRVKPGVAEKLLPAPFRPKLVGGWAMAGICLIRLERIRPRFAPAAFGFASENAAHRIAVEWDEDGIKREGVFIPRRDTNSRINSLAGGRVFPGVHQIARFNVHECEARLEIEIQDGRGARIVRLAARRNEKWPADSVFKSAAEASDFFRNGACGWSPGRCDGEWEGIELRTNEWRIEPLIVEHVRSSFFDDPARFPAGSVEFDSALLMRDIQHEWHALGSFKLEDQSLCAR